jgi:pimeloyl-ACP methyl ester carboxylesterase
MGEHRHYRAFREMTDGYFRAVRAGETAAIESMIDFYGGPGAFAAWPERVRRYAVETTAVNILDWASAYGFALTPAALASVEVPTLVLWGAESHPAVRRANELLGRCIAGASVVALAGASHFMIATHDRIAGPRATAAVRPDARTLPLTPDAAGHSGRPAARMPSAQRAKSRGFEIGNRSPRFDTRRSGSS